MKIYVIKFVKDTKCRKSFFQSYILVRKFLKFDKYIAPNNRHVTVEKTFSELINVQHVYLTQQKSIEGIMYVNTFIKACKPYIT